MQRALVASALVFCALVVWVGIGEAQFNPNAPASPNTATPTKPPGNLGPSQPGSLLAPPGNTNIGIPSQNIPQPSVGEESNSTVSKKKKDRLTGKDKPTKVTGKPAGKVTGKKETPGTSRANVDTSKKLGGRATELPAKSRLPIDPDALTPAGWQHLKEILDLLKVGPLKAGVLPSGGSKSGRPDIPVISQGRSKQRGQPTHIGRAPVPFTDPSGKASAGHQSGPYGDNRESGWRQTRGDSHTGRAGTTFVERWTNDRGDTYTRTVYIDEREGGEFTIRETTQRADGSGEGTHTDKNGITHIDVAADGTVTANEKPSEKEGGEKPSEKEGGDKPKDKYPNESASRGGIVCFTELQCRDAIEAAQKEAKKLPGPGGMPTEAAGTGPTRGRGTVPGDATDPNPDDIGSGSGGGGASPPDPCRYAQGPSCRDAEPGAPPPR